MVQLSRRQVTSALGGTLLGATGIADARDAGAGTDTAESDRLIGAHYYTWYGPDNHWSNGYTGTPVLGEYDSGDPAVVEQHVDWASSHGIDWFNVTWWGEDSYSGRTLRESVAPLLEGSPVEFSILYESKGVLRSEDGQVDFDDPTNRTLLGDHLEHFAETYMGNENYLHVDGKPVLYVYIARTFTGDVVGAFADAQARAGEEFYLVGDYGWSPSVPDLEVFDAVSPYNMYRPVEGVNEGFVDYVARQYQRWRLLADEFDFQFVPLTLPGFDNTEAAWAPDGQPVLERSPEQYRKICETARKYMDPDQPMALITSFNEWHEYTSVEPGESFGTTYLEITRDDLAGGDVGSGTGSLVPMTFHWRRAVAESSLNPDIPEGTGRDLTLAVHDLNFVGGDGEYVKRYDVGASPEPIFTQGVSGAGSHEDLTWRWFTAGARMQSRLYVPDHVASAARWVEILAKAADDDFTFEVTFDESADRTTVTMPGRRTETTFRLPGVETPTRTQTPTASPTETPTSTSTDSPMASHTRRDGSRTTTEGSGFSLLAGAGAVGAAALDAIRRRSGN